MEVAPNPFDAFAEAVKPQWQRTRERATAKAAETRAKAKSAAEKKLDEEEMLEKLYLKAKRAQRAELLAGPYGKDIKGLMAFLRTMTLSSAPALIKLIEISPWVRNAPEDVRFAVLGIVDRGIADLRETEGFDRYDDPLWDEEPNAFQVIKKLVEVR